MKNLSLSTIRVLTLSGVLLATVSLRAAEGGAIAKVGDEEISADKIRTVLEGLNSNERATLEQNPALLNQTVRTLILQQVLLKEALATGWDKQPDVVEKLELLRQGAIAQSYLEAVTKVPEGFPSEADVQAAYEAKKDALQLPRQIRLAEIFVSAPKGADKASADKAKARIDAIQKKVKASGSDFATVARTESEERESAAKGGEIGWLAEASIQPEIRKRVAGLGKDGVSETVQLDDGWYVVKVLEVKEPRTATLDEVRDQLVKLLRAERAKQNREAYLARLQQQNPVVINELALSKLLEPAKN